MAAEGSLPYWSTFSPAELVLNNILDRCTLPPGLVLINLLQVLTCTLIILTVGNRIVAVLKENSGYYSVAD